MSKKKRDTQSGPDKRHVALTIKLPSGSEVSLGSRVRDIDTVPMVASTAPPPPPKRNPKQR